LQFDAVRPDILIGEKLSCQGQMTLADAAKTYDENAINQRSKIQKI